ncbi:MAG: hypothetical protein ACYCZY_07645 [Lacisediminihabitans sp.]
MPEASEAEQAAGGSVVVEITADGYLRLPAEFCHEHFPQDRCAGLRQDESTFVVMPVSAIAPNALIMKQRNLAGQRSVLIREVCGDDYPVGQIEAIWLSGRRRLILPVPPNKEVQ